MMKQYKLSEIVKNQPILNVGCIGHVAHGKSTLVKALTGIVTPKHSKELERSITINLGYANLFIYLDEHDKIHFSNKELEDLTLIKHISFVDCPGHKALMSTMISGSKVMDAALLLVAGNDTIPQEQTSSHTEILKYTDISDVLILLNKIDLFKKTEEIESAIEQLENFVSSVEELHDKPIVPISAFKNINIDQIGRFLCNLPVQNMDLENDFSMCVLRSFDVNHLNSQVEELQGGVIGGSIQSGYIEIGDHVMILPGLISKEGNNWISRPIYSKVVSLFSEKRPLEIAFPGGLIGIGLDLDPSFCKQNKFLGNAVIKLTKERHVSPDDLSTTISLHVDYVGEIPTVSNIMLVVNSRTISGNIINSNQDRTILTVLLEIPIVIVPDVQYSMLSKVRDVMELFGVGRLIDSTPDVEIKLPKGLDSFYETIPDPNMVTIVNDLPIVNFDTSSFTLENILDNILPHLTQTKERTKLPKVVIEKETTRFVWTNFTEFDRLFRIEKLRDDIKLYPLKNVVSTYIQYIYNETTDCNDKLICHVKNSKKLKAKPENTISGFFKRFYQCSKCNEISMVVKIQSKTIQLCFNCSERVMLSEPWIKDLKL